MIQNILPDIVHVGEVADLTARFGGSEAEIAAAWLHDTVEDTPVTILDIEKEFGKEIAEIVDGLTDLPDIEKLPTKERKARQAERVATESKSIKRVKLADQTSNVGIVGECGMTDMPIKEKIEYIEGARSIAAECRGISIPLDDLFEETYQAASKKLNSK